LKERLPKFVFQSLGLMLIGGALIIIPRMHSKSSSEQKNMAIGIMINLGSLFFDSCYRFQIRTTEK